MEDRVGEVNGSCTCYNNNETNNNEPCSLHDVTTKPLNTNRVVVLLEKDYDDGSTYYARVEIPFESIVGARDAFEYIADAFDIKIDEVVEEGFYGT